MADNRIDLSHTYIADSRENDKLGRFIAASCENDKLGRFIAEKCDKLGHSIADSRENGRFIANSL